jgi:hypothetical protein
LPRSGIRRHGRADDRIAADRRRRRVNRSALTWRGKVRSSGDPGDPKEQTNNGNCAMAAAHKTAIGGPAEIFRKLTLSSERRSFSLAKPCVSREFMLPQMGDLCSALQTRETTARAQTQPAHETSVRSHRVADVQLVCPHAGQREERTRSAGSGCQSTSAREAWPRAASRGRVACFQPEVTISVKQARKPREPFLPVQATDSNPSSGG